MPWEPQVLRDVQAASPWVGGSPRSNRHIPRSFLTCFSLVSTVVSCPARCRAHSCYHLDPLGRDGAGERLHPAQSHQGLALPGPRPRPGRPPGSPWPSPWPVTPGEPALPHAAPRGRRLVAPAGSASGARGFSQEAPSRPRRSSCWGCPAPDAGRAPPGPPDAGRAPAGPALSPRSLRLQHSLPRSTSPLEERKGTRHTVHTHRAVSPCAHAAVPTPGSSPVPVAGIPVAAE